MEDVEYLLPSEIARLVYGHLKKMGCHEISEKFLHSSPHLSECREIQKNNRTFKTEANGLPLKEILDQYLNMSKLILSAVNIVTEDSKKFTDPITALKFILKLDDIDTEDEAGPVVNKNVDSADHLDSSNDEIYSDISLNVNPTPDKCKILKNPQPKRLKSIAESPVALSNISQLDCHETNSNNPISIITAKSIVPRKSTRILNKRTSNDKRSNSDSVKDIRKNELDVLETPCKFGQPPYSESKIHKSKKFINLSSESELEPEPEHPDATKPPTLSVDDYYFTKDYVSKHSEICSLFLSSERRKNSPVKKTIKTLKPRRPPTPRAGSKTPESDQCQKKKIKYKRNQTLPVVCHNDKKTKLCSPVEINEDRSKSCSKEPVPIVDGMKVENPRNRRKSFNANENDEERTLLKQNKLNKSLSMIDNEMPVDVSVLKETLIDSHFKKFHERLAASINEVIINSPQKINIAGTEELDQAIQKAIHDAEADPMFDEILQTLLCESTSLEEESEIKSSCIITSPKENSETSSNLIYNDTQNKTNFNQNNSDSILIDLNQEETTQVFHQTKNVERSLSIAEDIRHYVSYTADISSSPDRENLELKNLEYVKDYANTSRVLPCEIQETRTLIIAPNSTLFPVNSSLPIMINKPAELQICGTLSQLSKPKKYVNIAPKTELMEEYSKTVQRGIVTKKRRVRGGKRG